MTRVVSAREEGDSLKVIPDQFSFRLFSSLSNEEIDEDMIDLANSYARAFHCRPAVKTGSEKLQVRHRIFRVSPEAGFDALVAYIDGKPAGVQRFRQTDSETVHACGLHVKEEFQEGKIGKMTREILYAHLQEKWITRFLIVSVVPGKRTPIGTGDGAQGLARSEIRDYGDAVIDVRDNPDNGKITGYGIDLAKLKFLYDTASHQI